MGDPLSAAFHDTVSGLAYSLAQPHANADEPALQSPFNDLVRFVLQQHSRMPDYLRTPLKAATLAFDLMGFARTCIRFHTQPPSSRLTQIARWKKSRLAYCRDLIRYHESLSTLALYSRLVQRNAASSSSAPRSNGVLQTPAAELRYEIVVIGSGPGGAITACLLAEAGRNVLLVEEGPYHELESCEPFSIDEMVQKYRNGGQTVALGRNKVAYVEGRCVGGGSEINSGLYHRTPPEILELWRNDFRVEAITEKDLAPHFEACEKELSVSLLPGRAPLASLKLHDGASRLGWKSLEVPRWFQYSDKSGQGTRQSMTKTFVPRFLRSGGHLLSDTRVASLHSDGPRWTVGANHLSRCPIRIVAGTVFVCAGAVQTPAILRRSGIREMVGNSLRLHPTIKLVARFPEAVNSARMGVPVHQVKEFAPRLSFGCSISSPPYLAVGLLDHPAGAQRIGEDWPHLAAYYAMITGQGRGTVRTIPKFHDPLVRYHLAEPDRCDLAEGLRKLSQILFESGAQTIYPGITGCPILSNADDLRRLPAIVPQGLGNLMTIHLFSSCPMGEDRSKCPVDSFGRVRGLSNLYVADASLLCTAPGVNPQGSIMALARRNVLHFLKR
jgi:choline dehydrogenase-like flavoprotein